MPCMRPHKIDKKGIMVNEGSWSVELQQSFANHASFPLNLSLIGTRNYRSTLESYKARLDQNEEDLCLSDEEYIHIPMREFYSGTDGITTLTRQK